MSPFKLSPMIAADDVLPSEEEEEEESIIIIIILSPTHHAVADDALLSDVAPAAVSPGTSLRVFGSSTIIAT